MARVHIETHGCTMNRSDSEIMAGLLSSAGHVMVGSPEEADVVILNTCNVKLPTERRMVRRAAELSASGVPLVAAGCMARTQPDLLRPYASVLLGPRSLIDVVSAVDAALSGRESEFLEDRALNKASMPRVRLNPTSAPVPVEEGCLGACTYCITRFSRGRLRSFPPDDVISAVAKALKGGAVEILLTGEDLGVYGWDLGITLADLLGAILSEIGGSYRIRVGMATPDSFSSLLPGILDVWGDERVYRFFHLPVQSGSDEILAAMGRRYTSADFLSLASTLRGWDPDSSISTDVIVGFPGEDGEDFEATLRLLESVKPDFVNMSRYGPRPGTRAAAWTPPPLSEVKRRSRELHDLVMEIKMRRNERLVGRELKVLVTERAPGGRFQARTDFYTPVALEGEVEVGKFYRAVVEEARSNYVVARVVGGAHGGK